MCDSCGAMPKLARKRPTSCKASHAGADGQLQKKHSPGGVRVKIEGGGGERVSRPPAPHIKQERFEARAKVVGRNLVDFIFYIIAFSYK